jgi:hypothetical protein
MQAAQQVHQQRVFGCPGCEGMDNCHVVCSDRQQALSPFPPILLH